MIDMEKRQIKEKGRLGPGGTISVDIRTGRVKFTRELLQDLSRQNPYGQWIENSLVKMKQTAIALPEPAHDLVRKQIAFGYTAEEIQTSLTEMAQSGKEMTYSMGDDTPLPSLSEKPQLLFRYFRQRFSQVTNPPIDHIRERMAMSMRMHLGYKRNFLLETPEHARRLRLDSPVLLDHHISAIEDQPILRIERIPITFTKTGAPPLLKSAVERLQETVVASVKSGMEIIILSDRDVSEERICHPQPYGCLGVL